MSTYQNVSVDTQLVKVTSDMNGAFHSLHSHMTFHYNEMYTLTSNTQFMNDMFIRQCCVKFTKDLIKLRCIS